MEYFFALWGQLQAPIKANLALPTCNVQKYTSTQMYEISAYVSKFLQLFQLFLCLYQLVPSSPTGKAKGTLAKSPYDYPLGPCCSSPTFKPLGLVFYV